MTTTRYIHDRPRRAAQRTLQFGGGTPRKRLTVVDAVSEDAVKRAVIDLLQHHPSVAFAHRINTGSGYLVAARDWRRLHAGGLIRSITARFIRFAFPGCSDILGMLRGGRFIAIECKSSDGTLSPEQIVFLDLVTRHGGLAIVARSIDDVLRELPLPSGRSAGLDIL